MAPLGTPLLPTTATLAFPLRPSSDKELTCLVCHREPCEWEFDVRGFGWRSTMGIHERCRAWQKDVPLPMVTTGAEQ